VEQFGRPGESGALVVPISVRGDVGCVVWPGIEHIFAERLGKAVESIVTFPARGGIGPASIRWQPMSSFGS